MGLFFRAFFSPFMWSTKTIRHTLEVFLMVQGWSNIDPRVLRNLHAVTFYRYKMYHIFGHGHYDIFIAKQNNLLIIKVSFSFIT